MNRILFTVLALLALSTAQAGQPIDQRLKADADSTVVVSNVKGEIRIEAWARDEVHLTGELGEGSEELHVSESKHEVRIEVRVPRNTRHVDESLLHLRVPAGVSVEVQSVSARIEIAGLAGRRISTGSVSGDVHVDARSEEISLRTVSGDIDFRGQTERASLNSVSGDIYGNGLRGELRATTVSGEVLLEGQAISNGRFESVSGDLDLGLVLAEGSRIEVDTLSGDANLRLPEQVSARVQVETFSGSIRSGQGEVQSARHGPHQRLDFVAGDGDGAIRIETFSGNVRISTDR